MALTFKDYHLKCDVAPTVLGGLRYEAPVNLTAANLFAGECSVGAFSYINAHGSFQETSFGRFCSIAEWVCTGPGKHPTQLLSTHPFVCDPTDAAAALSEFPEYRAILSRMPFTSTADETNAQPRKITIGNDVWVGTRALIMAGLTVGDGAIVGAGAIVTKDVPPYAVVAGVPARVIRYRFDEAIVGRLLELKWWNYDMSHVSNQVDYGKIDAVIEFMNRRIKSGRLPPFVPVRYELKQSGANYSVGRLASQ